VSKSSDRAKVNVGMTVRSREAMDAACVAVGMWCCEGVVHSGRRTTKNESDQTGEAPGHR
jgi:hypothetical protein